MRYLTDEREEVLLPRIDVNQTLEVAEMELEEGGRGMSLTLWALRDQPLTADQAELVSDLYFAYIDSMPGDFDTWHITWAVSNMFRHGDSGVKEALRQAYEDATERAADTHRLADLHVNGEEMYMGDAHVGGRSFAKDHLVVPGNPDYLQSVEEYKRETKD